MRISVFFVHCLCRKSMQAFCCDFRVSHTHGLVYVALFLHARSHACCAGVAKKKVEKGNRRLPRWVCCTRRAFVWHSTAVPQTSPIFCSTSRAPPPSPSAPAHTWERTRRRGTCDTRQNVPPKKPVVVKQCAFLLAGSFWVQQSIRTILNVPSGCIMPRVVDTLVICALTGSKVNTHAP